MEKNDVWLVVFLIMFSVVVAIALTSIRHSVTLSEEDHAKRVEAFGKKLEEQGVRLIVGTVSSPSVIILLESETVFLQKVQDLNAQEVFHEERVSLRGKRSVVYYVFNNDMTIAWKYRIAFAPTWAWIWE